MLIIIIDKLKFINNLIIVIKLKQQSYIYFGNIKMLTSKEKKKYIYIYNLSDYFLKDKYLYDIITKSQMNILLKINLKLLEDMEKEIIAIDKYISKNLSEVKNTFILILRENNLIYLMEIDQSKNLIYKFRTNQNYL